MGARAWDAARQGLGPVRSGTAIGPPSTNSDDSWIRECGVWGAQFCGRRARGLAVSPAVGPGPRPSPRIRKRSELVFSPGGKGVGVRRVNRGVLGVHGRTPRQVTVMTPGLLLTGFPRLLFFSIH